MLIDRGTLDAGRLDGKVAVVTGAGRGIGRETARLLAHLGARVVIAEQNETGRETEEDIRQRGGHALFVQTDVSDEGSVGRLRERVLEAYGQADILINNATVFTVGPLWQVETAEWDTVMAVNLRGAFLCIKAFLPQMLAQRRGVVVTMESAEGMPYLAPYLATKVGLRSLAGSLAQEVGEDSGVSVFCYGPGLVPTPGLNDALADLVPFFGISREEFMQQNHRQMVSPEISATGLVGAILHAPEFHGQEIGFAQGLAKVGLNGAGEPVGAAGAAGPGSVAGGATGVAAAGRTAGGEVGTGTGLEPVLALNRALEEILRANIREYDELNLFQRPIVKRMFQQGAGLKVEEWLALAEQISRQLESAQTEGTGLTSLTAPAPVAYVAQLRRLAKFILKQESDARGFFKNQADLDRALEALRERRSVVTRLADALEAAEA